MYRFPTDPELRKIWEEKVNRGPEWKASSASICEAHFAPEDFEPGLVCGKVKLKLDAIPSIFPDPNIIKLKKVRKKKSILCTTNYPKRSGWSFVPSPEHNMSD
ncbi:hypothetical protein SK128_003400 [Halocaridina rubra]|uniref:THAP-type domain-containing protein n=1 Tax=Halocaridina rubra TaxID=373956 RepID=A0AAN8WRI5_HALRR